MRSGIAKGRFRFLGGPGILVTAAFIGPGTITTCSVAGIAYGASLLWALAISILAGMILQEMTARLGVLGRVDLAEALRDLGKSAVPRIGVFLLVGIAVGFGCAAYETGNLIGAGLGLETAVGGDRRWWACLVGVVAGGLLLSGGYSLVGRILAVLVAVMGTCFLATAVALGPSPGILLKGLLVPSLDLEAMPMVLALVGTTVVPYNLFLHSAAARDRWSQSGEIGEARWDLWVSMAIGGLISAAILVTAAATRGGGSDAGSVVVADLALQLQPLLGGWATVLFGIGLFAAGLTSAMTAPLAAAAATTGILGLRRDPRSWTFRSIWAAVLIIGMIFAGLNVRPLTAILVAQAANVLLLPFAAAYLLWVMNHAGTLRQSRNGPIANLMGSLVVTLAFLLGLSMWFRLIG